MQIYSVNNTNFKANILPSRALTSALELAQSEARTGGEKGMKRAAKFYNSLRTIENDKTEDYFFIDMNSERFYPYIRLGNITRILEFFKYKENNIANAVIDGVNKLVENKYTVSEMVNEAKNVDLTKSFIKWAKV